MKGWRFATVAAVLVFLFSGTGTTYSLLTPDYVFAGGELPAEAAILTGSLALAVVGTRRLGAADRRLRAGVPDFGAWLPARNADHGEGRIELAAQPARLRRTALRAAVIVVAWVALCAGGLGWPIALDRAAADLLATGVRVGGSVVSVHDPVKGTPWIQVRYEALGTARVEEITRNSGHGYHVGDPVTVVFDPADPERVRTTEEINENRLALAVGLLSMVAGLVGLPFAANAAVGWGRRARAAAATGWRTATVTVGPRVPGRREIEVRYRDGSGIVLRCAASLRNPGPPGRRRAWIGGWGRQMVVLFPDGCAIPVFATGPRAQPISPVR